MGSIKIAGKNIVTQSGSDEPTISSNVVFPAGKVINFECKNGASTGSESIGTSFQDSGKGAVTYDVVSQTSKLFIQWNCHFQVELDNSNYRLSGALRSDVDSYASNISSTTGGSQPLSVNYGTTGQTLWIQTIVPINAFYDHNQTAGTTISFKVFFKAGGGTTGIYSWDAWGHTEIFENVTFIEVEQ